MSPCRLIARLGLFCFFHLLVSPSGLAQEPVPFTVENFIQVGQAHLFVQGGIPLPKGHASPDAAFSVTGDGGAAVEAEVKVTAFWPDGSVKWVLVRMQPDIAASGRLDYELHMEGGAAPPPPFARQDDDAIHVDTGALRFSVDLARANLLRDLAVNIDGAWVTMLAGGESAELFVEIERKEGDGNTPVHFSANRDREHFSASLEEAGPTVSVIRLEGVHASAAGEAFAPYTVRLYAYRNDARIRLYHTFVFDGEARRDFIRAIGLRLTAAPEKVTGYTLAGAQGPGHTTTYVVDPALPAWRRGWLTQNSADAFTIRKVIDPASNSPLRVAAGARSQGWGRLDTTLGVIGAAIRNFWQEYPKAIAIDAVDRTLTAWFYSPFGEPLDLRRYSDLGHHALYEAGAAGPGTPATPFDHDTYNATGIAKSSELLLDFTAPDAPPKHTAAQALLFQRPPLLRATPEWMAATGVFGHFGTVPASGPAREHFDTVSSFYAGEQERHRWYSFIDYGDAMHSYNPGRGEWRFDEGGYAWLNNEGQIACGHWMAYLASGDERLYRFAEAMTRHVQDVDMYQIGPFAGRGMRHNVNHWGCSNRERRMTIPQNKRIYHFLSGDEHTRDRIHFIYGQLPKGEGPVHYPAMDFAVGATALLYLWESTGEARYGDALQKACEAFGSRPIGGYGFPAHFELDLATGEGGVADGTPMLADFFLTFFGPLRALMETADLTGNQTIIDRVLTWTSLLLESEEVAKEHQLHFATDIGGVYAHLHAAAFAYRHKRDARYLDIVWRALAEPNVIFESRGGDGPLEWPQHQSMIDAYFQSNSNSITLYNYPFAFPWAGAQRPSE